MPTFQDDLFLGGAFPTPAGIGGIGNPGGTGIGPLGRTYNYDIVPLAASTTNIAAAQAPGAAGNLTLTAGTGVTSVQLANGNTYLRLDVPRCVSVTSSGNISARTITVTGLDYRYQPMTEAITGPNATTVNSKKAFAFILSVAINGSAANISVGTADMFGLPFRVTDAGYVFRVGWDNTLADNAATFVAADTTSPATSTTGDVRGTVAQAGNAANGSRRLVVGILLTGIACGPDATAIGAYGVTQA